MEPAIIDWKNIDSKYVADELYEHIDAPKWLDLSGASPPVDDDADAAYFCRPECRHPKTAEDFLTRSPTPKLTPLRERISSNQSSKRRGRIAVLLPSPSLRESAKSKANAKKLFSEDLENCDPNLLSAATVSDGATAAVKAAKEAVKPSADERAAEEEEEEKALPGLKSKLSARNLFSREILSQLSEFCHDIKKMAVVVRGGKPTPRGESNVEEEKKVLWEPSPNRLTLKVQTGGGSCNKGCGGNTPVLREVRGCPPTPQRFPSPSGRRLRSSRAAAASTSSSPLHKPPKSSTLGDHGGRGVLQELLDQSSEKNRTLAAKDEFGTFVPYERERSFADMFWFFKPCTHSVK